MAATYQEIPVNQLIARDDNLRDEHDTTADDDLVASVRSVGILQPLRVVKNGRGFYVNAGHRRLDAAQKAGLRTVPCVIVDEEADDVSTYTSTMLVENLQRKNLSPIMEAEGYKRLVDGGAKQAEVARLIGVPGSQVSRRLSLLTLPPETQQRVTDGELSVADAEKLAQLVRLDRDLGLIACNERWNIWKVETKTAELERKAKERAAVKAAEAHGLPVFEPTQMHVVVDPEAKKLQVPDTIQFTQDYTDDQGNVETKEFEESYDPKDALGIATAARRKDVKGFTYGYPDDDRPDGRAGKLSVLPVKLRDPETWEIPKEHPERQAVAQSAEEIRKKEAAERTKATKKHEEFLRSVLGGPLKASDVAVFLIESELRTMTPQQAKFLAGFFELELAEDADVEQVVVDHIAGQPAAVKARVALTLLLDAGFMPWQAKYADIVAPVVEKLR